MQHGNHGGIIRGASHWPCQRIADADDLGDILDAVGASAGRTRNESQRAPQYVEPAKPVPFIMRVAPPLSRDYKLTPASMDTSGMHFLEKAEAFIEHLTRTTPLCWPTDLLHAHWADLLFYMPHNSRRLMDVTATTDGDPNQNYAFDTPALKALVAQFQQDLRALDATLGKDPAKHFVPLSDIASSIQY